MMDALKLTFQPFAASERGRTSASIWSIVGHPQGIVGNDIGTAMHALFGSAQLAWAVIGKLTLPHSSHPVLFRSPREKAAVQAPAITGTWCEIAVLLQLMVSMAVPETVMDSSHVPDSICPTIC
jgi:hypothetical protein